jgi:hypothetical protein
VRFGTQSIRCRVRSLCAGHLRRASSTAQVSRRAYLEHGNDIEIVEAERKVSAVECPHVTAAWRFDSISAAEFCSE